MTRRPVRDIVRSHYFQLALAIEDGGKKEMRKGVVPAIMSVGSTCTGQDPVYNGYTDGTFPAASAICHFYRKFCLFGIKKFELLGIYSRFFLSVIKPFSLLFDFFTFFVFISIYDEAKMYMY